jgi:F-type H+-transporting ATPase subunit delta
VKRMTIARRYARALLLVGKEDGQAETYRKELARFSALMASEKNLERAITNPLYETEKRRHVLAAVLDKAGYSSTMKSFLLLLFDKRRIGFLSAIDELYRKLADELKGLARASLVSAAELSNETVEKIRIALSKMTGKDVVLAVERDSGLIGGIVTRIGDLVLDGSIKTQLLNLKESLKRGESV